MRRTAESEEARIDDELLVIRCQLGERRAFDELMGRWAARGAGYARRVSEDDDVAAELTQDIWLRVFRGVGRLHDPRRFRSWLFGIAHRAFADTLRRRYRAFLPLDDNASQLAEDEVQEDHRDLESMQLGLARLPPVEREILTLFYLQELTIEETADALSIPAGVCRRSQEVRSRWRSGRNVRFRDSELISQTISRSRQRLPHIFPHTWREILWSSATREASALRPRSGHSPLSRSAPKADAGSGIARTTADGPKPDRCDFVRDATFLQLLVESFQSHFLKFER